jgi:hypothetical protein
LDGKRANELRELLGAVDDFESDEERVEALAEPAFTPDSPVPQSTTVRPPALPVNDDAAEAALATVDVGTLIELKGVNRAWRALGRRALCSRLCRREGHADPWQLDEITELNLKLLIKAGRPWEAVRAGRLLVHLERLTGYGFEVDVAAVREVDLDDNDGEVEEEVDNEEALKVNATLTKLELWANRIGRDGAKAIAEALKFNAPRRVARRRVTRRAAPLYAGLTYLGLGGNDIGKTGAKAIADALKSESAMLTELHLGACDIGPRGAKAIAKALKSGSAVLSKLELAGNYKMGDAGNQAVQDAVMGRRFVLSL